ncbi:hypothetical protein O3P69_006041 [Scylla paramamosain]|uniref:Uncharacterized protein n=1 Tax=Scylla paramamosain TaxID=85552 RepID=A0AAW0U4T7_SCYPA
MWLCVHSVAGRGVVWLGVCGVETKSNSSGRIGQHDLKGSRPDLKSVQASFEMLSVYVDVPVRGQPIDSRVPIGAMECVGSLLVFPAVPLAAPPPPELQTTLGTLSTQGFGLPPSPLSELDSLVVDILGTSNIVFEGRHNRGLILPVES